jgi:hypothetical protein
MTENGKTFTFLIAAALFAGVAYLTWPRSPENVVVEDTGQRFFASFDPLQASTLEISRFDDQEGAPRTFIVTQRNGVWSLPSNEDYPADAEQQLADAAAGIVDVIRGTHVSDNKADHELYGVIDPATAAPGTAGTGTRVRLADAGGATLAELIIGKTVKDKPELRYARLPGKDRVYTTKVSTDKLSMKFDDWIEKDLLKLDPASVTQIVVNAYSIDELNQRIIQGDLLELKKEPSTGRWTMSGSGPDEIVKEPSIENAKTALADLKIVDVHRKPAGLSRELRAVETLKLDETALQSLASKGYFVVNKQLLSNEGEMIVGMDSGVQYTLRFGEVTAVQQDLDDPGAEDTSTKPPASAGNNRYLFVVAQVNESLIPQPKIKELPLIPGPLPPLPPDEAGNAPNAEDQASMQKQMEDAVNDARAKTEESNKREQERYINAVTTAKQKVDELNARFADWYYVIADDVYRKIRLARADVVESTPRSPETVTTPPLAETQG